MTLKGGPGIWLDTLLLLIVFKLENCSPWLRWLVLTVLVGACAALSVWAVRLVL